MRVHALLHQNQFFVSSLAVEVLVEMETEHAWLVGFDSGSEAGKQFGDLCKNDQVSKAGLVARMGVWGGIVHGQFSQALGSR